MPHQHVFPLRVYYEDTDFSGFVYHASYLRFLERGRTEFLRTLGIDHSRLYREEAGLVLVVARLTVDYLRPARMDDELTIRTTFAEIRGPVLKLDQSVLREATDLVEAKVLIATVRDGRPVRLPARLRAALATVSSGASAARGRDDRRL